MYIRTATVTVNNTPLIVTVNVFSGNCTVVNNRTGDVVGKHEFYLENIAVTTQAFCDLIKSGSLYRNY